MLFFPRDCPFSVHRARCAAIRMSSPICVPLWMADRASVSPCLTRTSKSQSPSSSHLMVPGRSGTRIDHLDPDRPTRGFGVYPKPIHRTRQCKPKASDRGCQVLQCQRHPEWSLDRHHRSERTANDALYFHGKNSCPANMHRSDQLIFLPVHAFSIADTNNRGILASTEAFWSEPGHFCSHRPRRSQHPTTSRRTNTPQELARHLLINTETITHKQPPNPDR